jgi:hypothetical protein
MNHRYTSQGMVELLKSLNGFNVNFRQAVFLSESFTMGPNRAFLVSRIGLLVVLPL